MPHADLSDPGPKHLSGASARPVPQAYQYLYVPPAARANVTSKAPLRLCRPSARDLHLGRSSDLSDPGPQHLSRTSTARAPTIPAKLLSVSAGPVPEISTSGEVTDRKSRFVGHAAKVGSLGEVRAFVDGVLDDKRVRRATHPAILAWRVEGESGHDDGGEASAGRNLLALLETLDVQGAVAVTRWYGGTPLGPARFRHINAVAREALGNAGMTK